MQQLLLMELAGLSELEKLSIIRDQKVLNELVNLMSIAISMVHEAKREEHDKGGKGDVRNPSQ